MPQAVNLTPPHYFMEYHWLHAHCHRTPCSTLGNYPVPIILPSAHTSLASEYKSCIFCGSCSLFSARPSWYWSYFNGCAHITVHSSISSFQPPFQAASMPSAEPLCSVTLSWSCRWNKEWVTGCPGRWQIPRTLTGSMLGWGETDINTEGLVLFNLPFLLSSRASCHHLLKWKSYALVCFLPHRWKHICHISYPT